MPWTSRSIPSTSWTNDRDSIGNFRITEGGDQRITESIFLRITEGLAWVAGRVAVVTTWVNRIIP